MQLLEQQRNAYCIAQECTGCELCIAPCPVDCIDMLAIEPLTKIEQEKKSTLARQRYAFHQARLSKPKPSSVRQGTPPASSNHSKTREEIVALQKKTIQEALTRIQLQRKEKKYNGP